MKCLNLSVIAALCLASLSAADCSASDPVVIASGQGAKHPNSRRRLLATDGSVHIVYGTGDTVQYCQSVDGGFDVSESLEQAFRVPNMSLGMRRGPRIVKTKAAIVVTAIGGQIGKGRDGDVLAWRSMDDGKTWQGPVRVNDTADSAREGLHAMASGHDGSIWCVWLDLRDKKSEIYATVSKDDGATWEANQCVYRSPDGSVCECCHPSVIVKWQQCACHVSKFDRWQSRYVCYIFNGRWKVVFRCPETGSGTWQLDACPMDGGMLAVSPKGFAGNSLATRWKCLCGSRRWIAGSSTR
jgi:hypothetical protein